MAWYIPGVKTPNVSSKFIGKTKSWLTILGLKNNLALLKSCGWKNWQTYVRNGNGDQSHGIDFFHDAFIVKASLMSGRRCGWKAPL